MNEQIIESLKQNYGLMVVSSEVIPSYFKRVWDVQTEKDGDFVVKILGHLNETDINHWEAKVAFCDLVNTTVPDIKTVRHVKSHTGAVLQKGTDGSYFVVMEKHPIVTKNMLTPEEERNLGLLMSEVHSKVTDFDNQGLGTSSWMREVDDEGFVLLEKAFPDQGYLPYKTFMEPLDYEALGLRVITIHGDWHKGNMSFTNPPFLFDLDTLSRGAAVEEIARTLTHWYFWLTRIGEFYKNLTTGYVGLSESEKKLIPVLVMTQLYSKYVEFSKYGDRANSGRILSAIPQVKQTFGLE